MDATASNDYKTSIIDGDISGKGCDDVMYMMEWNDGMDQKNDWNATDGMKQDADFRDTQGQKRKCCSI